MNSNKVQSVDLLEGETYRAGMKEVLTVAWPASLTMLNGTIMSFIDGLMVARVGAISLNAQFIGGITSFVTEAFFIGILGVVNTFVAQNFGAGQYKKTTNYVRAGIAISWAAAIFAIPMAVFGENLFSSISKPVQGGDIAENARNIATASKLIALETMYFQYFILTLGVRLTNMTLSQFFFGIGKQRVVFIASTASTIANIILNYILIYGKCGLPAMGLEGAAIGSVISFGLSLAIVGWVYLAKPIREKYDTLHFLKFKWKNLIELLQIGWPSGLQFFSDMFCWFLFTSVIISRFGHEAVAATVVTLRYMNFSFMPTVGLSIATTSLVGKYIGMGKKELVRKRVGQASVMAMIYMGFCALMFMIFREPLVSFFVSTSSDKVAAVDNAEVIRLGKQLLLCAAVFQISDAVAITYCGALRGAGDTRWQMVISIITHWPLVVGGGWIAAKLFPSAGVLGPWTAATLCIIAMAALLHRRFRNGKWENIDLLKLSPAVDKAQAGDIELM